MWNLIWQFGGMYLNHQIKFLTVCMYVWRYCTIPPPMMIKTSCWAKLSMSDDANPPPMYTFSLNNTTLGHPHLQDGKSFPLLHFSFSGSFSSANGVCRQIGTVVIQLQTIDARASMHSELGFHSTIDDYGEMYYIVC